MDVRYPSLDEPATAEYILAVLRDMHRQQCQLDPIADPSASLSFDSTVAKWREACDLLGWRELGRACNQSFDIDHSDAEWRAVLVPATGKRLGAVCASIARSARRRRIRPAKIFGSECVAAGAFLTVRSLLSEVGVPAEEIAPSTALSAYTRRYSGIFLGSVSQLSPGSLPPVRFRAPVYDAGSFGIMAGILCLIAGFCSGWNPLGIGGFFLLVVGILLTWVGARFMLPASVEFGELRTFRDLAEAMVRDGHNEADFDTIR